MTVSYDVLALLEEIYENIECNNYWEFLGTPLYDSLRPCSIIMDPFPYIGMGREVFMIINEAPTAFEPITLLNQNFQHPLMERITEIVLPFPSYLVRSVFIHLNKIKAGRRTGMIFITQLHGIYCLSFRLNHEGMNYFAGNFKISRII